MQYNKAIKVLELMYPHIRHPIKKHKAYTLIHKYASVTPRNGYYTDELKQLREDFEEEFFKDFI